MDEALTLTQVCDRLKLHENTVYRMLLNGTIKGTKVGKKWRVLSSEVDRILAGEK